MATPRIPLVIGSHPGSPWINDWPRFGPRRVHIHRDGGYELTALRAAVDRYPRFIYLQDSCEVLSPAFWTTIDALTEPTWIFGPPGMYLGVYDSAELRPVLDQAPTHVDKRTSIEWEGLIRDRLPHPTIWGEVTDAVGRMEERHGRMNLVLENQFLRKFKGNWGQGV